MTMNADGVLLSIKAESIYMHTISALTFNSVDEFEVEIPIEIIQIEKGHKDSHSNKIKAIKENENKYTIELSVIGLFQEKKVIEDNEKLGNHYGTRFYPFVSSEIKKVIRCSKLINYVILNLPDTLSPMFKLSSISQNNQLSAGLRHSRENEWNKYVFSWNKNIIENESNVIQFDVQLRFSGISILRMVEFPICYWMIALVGLALLYNPDKENMNVRLFTGAIVSALLFMLQRWNKSSVPQRNTLLTHLYILYGSLLVVWGYLWYLTGSWSLLLLIPIALILFQTFWCVVKYIRFGKLTNWFSEKYARMIISFDEGFPILDHIKKTTISIMNKTKNIVSTLRKRLKSKDKDSQTY